MTYGLLLAGGGLIALAPHARHAVLGHGRALRDHGPRHGLHDGAHDGRGDELGGPAARGLGSAMTNTSREVGGVFGIALLGTILFTRLEAVLAPSIAGLGLSPAQQETITAAAGHGQLDVGALGLTPDQAAAVGRAFGEAFLSGFRLALVVAGFALLARLWWPTDSSPAATPRSCGLRASSRSSPRPSVGSRAGARSDGAAARSAP